MFIIYLFIFIFTAAMIKMQQHDSNFKNSIVIFHLFVTLYDGNIRFLYDKHNRKKSCNASSNCIAITVNTAKTVTKCAKIILLAYAKKNETISLQDILIKYDFLNTYSSRKNTILKNVYTNKYVTQTNITNMFTPYGCIFSS